MEPRLSGRLVTRLRPLGHVALPGGAGALDACCFSCCMPSPATGQRRPRRWASLGARAPQAVLHGAARRRSAAQPTLHTFIINRLASLGPAAMGV